MIIIIMTSLLISNDDTNYMPTQVTVVVETSVSQTLTALEIRSLLAQLVLETAVLEQMTASHTVLQETVVNALVSIKMHDL